MEESKFPKKPNIRTRSWNCLRDNCCSARGVLKNLYCTSLAKTGNKCEELKPLAHLIALICLFAMFCIPYVISYTYNHFFEAHESVPVKTSLEQPNTSQTASIISASTDINIETPENNTPDNFSKCDLNAGEWVRWLGKVNQDFEDKTHFTLPVVSTGALFKYIGKIDDFSSCEFIFISRSENSINYVISLDEIYQIVVGDNDLWTIAVRATDAIEGDLVPIKEDSTQKTRPRLLGKIKNGTTVKVILNQKFIDSNAYQIELVVSYKPDSDELSDTQTSKFTWTFEPSPAILENPSLSVGLLRGPEDKSEIGVNFIEPRIGQDNKEVDSLDNN